MLVWIGWILTAAGVGASQGGENRLPKPRPVIEALRIDEPLTVDGVLDEAAWERAPRSGDFFQRQPDEFAPTTEATEIQIAYTATMLYVAVRAHDGEPEKIVAGEMGLDSGLFRDDSIVLLFDTFHDRRNAYFFETNPNSSRTDSLVTDEGRDFNVDWDTIWTVRCRVHESGWTAEFAIPFSSLRYEPQLETWGFQVRRTIKRKEELALWSPIGREADLFRMSQAGEIRGLRDLEVGRNLRVTPFVTGASASRENASGDNTSGDDHSEESADAGLDVKWGITDGLTLDFPEKRAFFLENAGIFQFGSGLGASAIPFFSRRIGIARDGRMVDLDYGARLAGRAGSWNLGLLGARTGSLSADPENGLGAVPENTWGVARVKRNLGERSFVGLIATHRDGDDGSRQTVFGVDANWKPTDRWDLWAFAQATDEVGGDGATLAGGDDDGDGDVYGGSVRYQSDDFDGWLAVSEAGENYDPDAGFRFRNGYRNAKANLLWLPRPEQKGIWKNVRNTLYELTVDYFEDSEGEKESMFVEFNPFGVQYLSGSFFTLFPQYQFERLGAPFEIFEGVVIPAGEYEWFDGGFVVRTATSRPVDVDWVIGGGEFFDGDRFNTTLSLRWRPGKLFRSQTTWDHNQVDLPAGSFDTSVFRQSLELSFTPDLVISALVQASDASESLGLNLRLNWHYRPGSDLFVVYNHGWDLPDFSSFGELESRARQLVVKWTWAWQS